MAADPLTIAVGSEDPHGADALELVAELCAALTAITGASRQASFAVAGQPSAAAPDDRPPPQ